MGEHTKARLLYIGLLAAGLLCPVILKLADFSGLSEILTFLWLYVFLELTCRFRTKKQLLLTGLDFLAGYSVLFWGVLGTTWYGLLLPAAAGMLVYGGYCLAARIMLRWNRFPVTLVFPAFWLCGFFLAYLLRFPSLFRVDMLFSEMLVLLQCEQLIGSVGLCFAVLWILSIFRYAAANRKLWCACTGAGLLLALLVPGIVLLYPNTEAAESLRVAYTTGPYVGDFLNYTGISYEANEESLVRAVSDAAEQGAEILVFNEEAFAIADTEETRFLDRCSALAAEHNLAVLLGLDLTDTDDSLGGRLVNEVVLIDNTGAVLDSYQKTCLIPILEAGYAPGDGTIPSCTLTLNGKTVKLSYLICYDSNFPLYVRQLDPDTDILFLPSWDWPAVTKLHSGLCRCLAAENQVCILKPTYDGLSVAVSADGQIFQESSTDTTGFEQVQLVDMPLQSTEQVVSLTTALTPMNYAMIGAEILSVLICLLLLIVTWVTDKKLTRRTRWFLALVAADLVGSAADAFSWLMDGCVRLNTLLLVVTIVSLVTTLVMIGLFSSYLTEYIREKQQISLVPVIVSWSYVCVTGILTIVASLTGDLFVLENGVYSEQTLYSGYVFANTFAMVIGIAVVFAYRKALSRMDRAIAYVYMIIPVVMAVINLFVEDWCFAYPSITLSLVLAYITLQSDQMQRLQQEGEIVGYHAAHDELTGLFNRRAFNDKLEVLRTVDGTSGVIYSDVNGLKYTNDRFGHSSGDQRLIHYAELLSGIFRSTDLYRISGDEFLCLMQNVTEESFRERVHQLQEVLQQDAPPIASIGTAFGSNQELEALISLAEDRMYDEKQLVYEQYPDLKR